ncbi:MAG: glycosyltransferase [Deltaproteobacteria bacterium]|nr:glycosyltransferase [Deltaproteobacteria bacterium]
MRRTLLWITSKWPLPAVDGSRVATTNLISSLTKKGHLIDLLALAGEHEHVDLDLARRELGVRRAFVIRRKERSRHSLLGALQLLKAALCLPHIPITMHPFQAPKVRRPLTTLIEEHRLTPEICGHLLEADNIQPWDVIVYEGPHAAIHSSLLGEFKRPACASKILYRAQNVESSIWQSKLELASGTFKKILLAHQYSLVKIFEESFVRSVDGVAAVSSADLSRFQSLKSDLKGRVVPVSYDFSEPLSFPDQGSEVLFMGRLDWPPNQEGLRWFLEMVWPELLKERSDLTLLIVGSGASSWLNTYLKLKNINFLGCVSDPTPLYARASMALVPIFYGGGTRVKAIEAARFGRAVLSTAFGVEGLGLESGRDYLRAENAKEWVNQLARLDHRQLKQVGQNAYDRLKFDFSAKRAVNEFEALMDQII